jgi:SulP family sulfate permease
MFSITKDLLPKIEVLFRKGYSSKEAFADIGAALSIAMVSLPLSIAFAIAAGASPQQGIVCGVVLGFFASLLGGSRHAIAGPTGAFVVIIFDIIARQGMDGLGTAMLVGGIILVLFGLFRLGSFIRFIPYPLINGFTTALGLLIFLGQFKDGLGLPVMKEPGFVKLVYHIVTNIHQPNLSSVLILATTLLSIYFLKKKLARLPWAVVSILLATGLSFLLDLDVPTLGSRFGSLSLFPWPQLPKISLSLIPQVFSDGFTIAALAGIEALLCCLVADAMSGTRHRSNSDLVAQGVGTIACGLLGGIPGTNAISRTAANIKAGGRSPVAGILHAVVLALIFAFLGPYCSYIPLAALAAVLMSISWNMADVKGFIQEFRAPKADIAVMVVTFLLTIFIDITVAVQIGMILAAILFVYQQSKRFEIFKIDEEKKDQLLEKQKLPPSTDVYQLEGPLFFGAIDRLKVLLKQDAVPKFLILNMRYIPEIDASGMNMMKNLYDYLRSHGCKLYLVDLKPHVKKAMDRYSVTTTVGDYFICETLKEAIDKVKKS